MTLRNSAIDVTPAITNVNLGDKITFHVHATDPGHGFVLLGPGGETIISDMAGTYPVGQSFDCTFTILTKGTFVFYCTHPTCGSGHNSMVGQFVVGTDSGDTGPRY